MTLEALKRRAKDETIFQLLLTKEMLTNRASNCKERMTIMESSDYIETEDGEVQYNDLSDRCEIAEESASIIDEIIMLLKMM